ncbi:MAG: hypothetical protein ACXVAV_17750 [Ktedonobacteraceae bacterium]
MIAWKLIALSSTTLFKSTGLALTPLPPLPWQPDQPESGPEQARLF